MKIATWNLERPHKLNRAVLDKISDVDADILILTETNSIVNPGKDYVSVMSKILSEQHDKIAYKTGENRTTIWSKYEILNSYKTFDDFTSVCAEIKTPLGILVVYGTIIGVFGGIGKRFVVDLESQIADFEKLSENKNFCIAGDFNVFFSGYSYPSVSSRKILNETFQKLNLVNTTSEINENVDHIVLSESFLENQIVDVDVWNTDKKLSDHIGICLSIIKAPANSA